MTGSDLFALRESHSLFGGRGAKPVQLTTEALSLWSPTPNLTANNSLRSAAGYAGKWSAMTEDKKA